MFHQFAKRLVQGRRPDHAVARPPAPGSEKRTSRLPSHRPLLVCVWRTDHGTDSLRCRWISSPPTDALAIEPDPGQLMPIFQIKYLQAA